MMRFFIPLFVLIGLFACAYGAGIRYNPTASMPQGVYRLVPGSAQRGSLVAFSLSTESPYADRARLYLGESNNMLLKRVAALPGDTIAVTSAGITVNGKLQPSSKALSSDRFHRSLPVFLSSGIVPAGQALVLSASAAGFDGRYFGLVAIARLTRVVPVFIFNKET